MQRATSTCPLPSNIMVAGMIISEPSEEQIEMPITQVSPNDSSGNKTCFIMEVPQRRLDVCYEDAVPPAHSFPPCQWCLSNHSLPHHLIRPTLQMGKTYSLPYGQLKIYPLARFLYRTFCEIIILCTQFWELTCQKPARIEVPYGTYQ